MHTRLAVNGDLPPWAAILACVLVAVSLLVLLVVELRRRERGGPLIVVTGLLALGALLCAVLRPVRIAARESVVGAKVVVLADTSRSMALPESEKTPRGATRDRAITELGARSKDARLAILGFGEGAPAPFAPGKDGPAPSQAPRSDLTSALRAIAASAEERPQAVVVVSDGRLDDPPEGASKEAIQAIVRDLKVPVHTIATTKEAPADASVRRVSAAGAAVAHVPLPLTVEVGCAGGISCDELTVTARELREDGPPALLASGLTHLKDGKGTVDLAVTLERAGARIIEVAITPPSGDTIPENDRRLLTFNVARERVRVLHVAGRPTNDVRALREWLKSDASVDVVAFFILRTQADDPNARQEDLSLIPFPVDELFTEHLPSFDAVVLQDFDAQPYGLERHLPQLARYVRAGGGLIMVGGQNSFVAGGYAGTPLADVLPITMDGSPGATAADVANVVPAWTDEGRSAPLLAPLREVASEELPLMPGANVLGDVRPGGLVLWAHPSRTTRSGAPMPILAIGDQGDGRSIALGIDGAWQLEFSQLGARTSGRGYGALWDGLLGWLMRDPRFESGQLELASPCVANEPARLRVRLPKANQNGESTAWIELRRLDKQDAPPVKVTLPRSVHDDGTAVEVAMPPLAAGGYTARLRLGAGPTTRRDFACESGGDEWADSRPDVERLRAIADATGGAFRDASGDLALPLPKPAVVSAERHVVPVAPPWIWTLAAACALGVHWFARRRSGLS
ncbi:glutamine amidotransferase [Labilithrix luteola]|uniref:glutamine amidotransferase n=1 Tax=Labilithrix luteola TaxID=1391654 RepID=UPI000A7900AC|nr:glutamine amidotransferase [Labilithrix luteola]